MDPQPDRCRWSAAYGRRTTAGEVIATDYSINYAHMVFSTNVCWYLDNTFCVMFHSLLAAGMDATLILRDAGEHRGGGGGEGGGGEGEGGRRAGAPPARDAPAAQPVQGEQRVVEVDGVESTSGRSCVCRYSCM